MGESITERGIVLSTSRLGEYDKRAVILTENCGKITAFANGAMRKNSPLAAAAQSFVMAAFTLYPGRDAYRLTGAKLEENFFELTLDPEKYATASYVTELTQYYTQENLESKAELNLLYCAFHALLDDTDTDTVRAAFTARLLEIQGEAPDMIMPEGLDMAYVNPSTGHLQKEQYGYHGEKLYHVSPRDAAIMNMLYRLPLPKVCKLKEAKEVSGLTEYLLDRMMDRPLKSAATIKQMQAFM